MTVLLALWIGGTEPVVLREEAAVTGRYIRLSSLVAGEVPAPLAGVWLGRSPEPGRSVRIPAARIRRELAWRGIELEIEGDAVDVVRAGAEAGPAPRTAVPAARGAERSSPAAKASGPVVKRGEIVRAVARGFDVDARALNGGRLGETVDLEYVGSRNRCRARVSGPGRAVVLEEER